MAGYFGGPEGPIDQSLDDPAAEAARVAEAADDAGVALRIVGGAAVALRCPSARIPPFVRAIADIDAAARSSARREVERLLSSLGYRPDSTFNALSGDTRLLFWDVGRNRQFDVFLDRIEMCHSIDFAARLDVDAQTLPLAELLLMKLQVVETNQKDYTDILALCSDHELSSDDAAINVDYLSRLVRADWGLWRTATIVAARAQEFARTLNLPDDGPPISRIREMIELFEAVPKTRRWRLRERVGDRVRWYELPEEVS